MKLLDIYARLKSDIQYIEQELERYVQSDHAVLNKTSLHLLKAGGKRIRPVFVLLAGQFGQYDLEKLKYVAVPLELIHMASLVHDDVIDNAETRRGKLTVKSKWDNRIAMYTGDYIFARALLAATELDDPRIHQILSKSIVKMSIGEIEQIRDFFNMNQSVRHYIRRIRRKTALLIAISCQLGAVAANADASAVRSLYSFGYNVGIAFQIKDDILDLCGTEKELGKPPGSDIKQGNITLPVIYAMADTSLQQALFTEVERIREKDGNTDVTPFLEMIRQSGAIGQAEQLSERYIARAIDALAELPDCTAKENLKEIAYFIDKRSY